MVMRIFQIFGLMVGASVLVSCAQLPSGKSALLLTSPQQEAGMGASAFANLKKSQKLSNDAAANERVRRIANRMIPIVSQDVPHAKWETAVFEDSTPNAFALPGGKIGIHTGLLDLVDNDDQLAFVIGHEVAHVVMRHGGQRLSQQVLLTGVTTFAQYSMRNNPAEQQALAMAAFGVGSQVGVTLPFSRSHESEADRYGMEYMAKAGYDPREAPKLWKKMMEVSKRSGGAPPEWLSTHPAGRNRIRQMEQLMPQAIEIYEGRRSSIE